MGPVASKAYPGKRLSYSLHPYNKRAKQAILPGKWRDHAGYIFGALEPKTGAVLTEPYDKRNSASFADFLEQVDSWIDPSIGFAILDNLATHRACDVLLFSLHPRWAFVFQPKYAAYLTLIEPWWTTLKSLALAGRRFTYWEVKEAVKQATAYWNLYKHPHVWGKRKRYKSRRSFGIASLPVMASP